MIEPLKTVNFFPRWLHAGAILAVCSAFFLLLLGQLVTSFRAGMADPIWPTEPWYLFNNFSVDPSYLIEHSHRIAGYIIGVVVILLALGLWCTEPRSITKWIAIFGMFVLVAGYGEFHRGLMAQRDLNTAIQVPYASVAVITFGFLVMFGVAIFTLLRGSPGATVRFLGSTALIAVMIQGLLGGFRVKLNALVGTDLAAVHGIFAQVVLSLLVFLAVLTERPCSPGCTPLNSRERSLGKWALFLTILLFVQVIWGAIIRHAPTQLTQRLHFLTAFLAFAVALLLLRAVFANRSARTRTGIFGWALGGLLIAQVYLGVEAWMMKFGMYTLPELVPITQVNATIRTLHALVGSGLLMSSLVVAVRLGRTMILETPTEDANDSEWVEQEMMPDRAVEIAARFGGNES
jgi:cytochrome c oxidase assembly protein subunit 15